MNGLTSNFADPGLQSLWRYISYCLVDKCSGDRFRAPQLYQFTINTQDPLQIVRYMFRQFSGEVTQDRNVNLCEYVCYFCLPANHIQACADFENTVICVKSYAKKSKPYGKNATVKLPHANLVCVLALTCILNVCVCALLVLLYSYKCWVNLAGSTHTHSHTHTHTHIYIYIYICVCVCQQNQMRVMSKHLLDAAFVRLSLRTFVCNMILCCYKGILFQLHI